MSFKDAVYWTLLIALIVIGVMSINIHFEQLSVLETRCAELEVKINTIESCLQFKQDTITVNVYQNLKKK